MTKYLLAAGAATALLLPAGVAGHAATGAIRTTTDTSAAYVLPSAISVDAWAHTVTLPLFKGRTASGAATWYVVTDASDQRYATAHGLNYAPKLANARGAKAVQHARLVGGVLTFDGTVSFNHARKVVPGPQGFPPAVSQPGSVGDAAYSPLVDIGGGIVLDASQVANDTGRGASVLRIDDARHQVTEDLFEGFVAGKRNFYLHQDASLALLSGLEASTYAPNLNAAPGLASDDPTSTRSAIIPIVNGVRGAGNPPRQGLQSAVLGQGDPLNVEQTQPNTPLLYSPVWDVTPAVWTPAAIAHGQRKLLTSSDDVAAAFAAGQLVSGGTGLANSSLSGLKAGGFISNCSVVLVEK